MFYFISGIYYKVYILIIEIQLDESIFQQAEFRLALMPVYKASHRKNGANQTGVIGEIIAERWLSANGIFYSADKTTQYDLRLLNNETIDVKTKERSTVPRLNFDCSVALYNHEHQRPNYYLFVSLRRNNTANRQDLRRFTHAYLVGATNQRQLHSYGRIIPANTVDNDNGMKNWTSMINISLDKLTNCEDVQSKWSKVSPNENALPNYRTMLIPKYRASTTSGSISNKVF
jgi:hypothetical protein